MMGSVSAGQARPTSGAGSGRWAASRPGAPRRAAPSASTGASTSTGVRPLQPFELERFFAKYEFCTRHLLCCSDCEPVHLRELLALADEDSLARWEALSLGYTESPGLPALREEVASMYEGVSPDEVVIGAPEELIYLTMRALLQPGDEVIVTYPGYQSLYEIAQSIGCRVRFWEPATDESGQLAFHVLGNRTGSLQAMITEARPALIVANFPHNPTGKSLLAADWAAVGALAGEAGATLFSDEMYRLLEPDSAVRLPAAVDAFPAAGVSLAGVSKTIGLPGLRIGWVATHNSALAARVLELKDYTTICASAPSEVLALMGLRASEPLLTANLAHIAASTDLLAPLFERHADILAWDPPTAGSTAFPRFLGDDLPGVDELAALAVEREGVLILPGSVYGCDRLTSERRFRLGLGRAKQDEAVAAFGRFLDERPWQR